MNLQCAAERLQGGVDKKSDVAHREAGLLADLLVAQAVLKFQSDDGALVVGEGTEHVDDAVGEVAIFDQRTGVLLGALSEEQFAFLTSQLEQESADDDDYYINEALIESLRHAGADAELLDLLQQAIGPNGEGDIRWDRR